MSLNTALWFAENGFHVFPLAANSKVPTSFMTGFFDKATRDEEQIKKWWLDPILETERDFNVGISTTKFREDKALLVVDVDQRPEKNGAATLVKLELSGLEFPPTFTQITPSGGKHFVYWVDTPVKQTAGALGEGIDTRSYHGYIAGWGSVINGKQYGIDGGAPRHVAQAPDWLLKRFAIAAEREKPAQKILPGVDPDRALKRAIEHAEARQWESSAGSRNSDGFKYACELKDFGITQAEAVEILSDFWACEPPLTGAELEAIVKNAWHYGHGPVGELAAEALFPADEVAAAMEKEEKLQDGSYLEDMNKRYAFVSAEGTHFILDEARDEDGQAKIEFWSEATFKSIHFNRRVTPDGKKTQTVAESWLAWKRRRQYQGVRFAPRRKLDARFYNLWKGFRVEPLDPNHPSVTAKQRAGFERWKEHLVENVAKGNKDDAKWITAYFAHLVQKPWQKPLTTMVMKGAKGTGKNSIVDSVGELIGPDHFITTADSRYLTSNFNGHLESCLMLCLDEAFWSGDKSSEGKLKALTTAPRILIERKGREPHNAKNYLRIIVLGNEDWVVPASEDERRYAVFEMGEGRKQDLKYFGEMADAFKDHGAGRLLLHYLDTFDLSQVNINQIPNTQGLQNQKIASLGPFHEWWFNSLKEGHILGTNGNDEWPEQQYKSDFRQAFERYCSTRKIHSRIPNESWQGRALTKIAPSVVTRKVRDSSEGARNAYAFPPVATLRAEWDQAMRTTTEWGP